MTAAEVGRTEACIALLTWIFTGAVELGYRGGSTTCRPPMRPEQRIAWMQRRMPRTYALLANNHRWDELFPA